MHRLGGGGRRAGLPVQRGAALCGGSHLCSGRHQAHGVLGEDDCLLREILFNPRTKHQVSRIREELTSLINIIDNHDEEGLNRYLTRIRENVK